MFECKCKMSLLRYRKPIGGLPDPRRSLFSVRLLHVITEANKEVQKATFVIAKFHGISSPDCPACDILGTKLQATKIKQKILRKSQLKLFPHSVHSYNGSSTL